MIKMIIERIIEAILNIERIKKYTNKIEIIIIKINTTKFIKINLLIMYNMQKNNRPNKKMNKMIKNNK